MLGVSVFTGRACGYSGGQFMFNSESNKGKDPHYSSIWCAALHLVLQMNHGFVSFVNVALK